MTDPYLLVGAGGVVGALARHLAGERIEQGTLDTLAVNVLGSLFLGFLVAVPVDETLLLLVGTGFCGAFTTFSTFAFETVRLYETGERRRAAAVAVLNLVGALAAVALGTAIASMVT
ncbi:fluoride efflux transporter FluC [Halorientalis halophila]|uniref:fluoride efflux transporter FluC n=1 Tax=Halorientalis halophila TaxID=3108499 RepID=UPI00300971EB